MSRARLPLPNCLHLWTGMLCLALLGGCAGSSPAPVEDRSSRADRSAPEVVSSTGDAGTIPRTRSGGGRNGSPSDGSQNDGGDDRVSSGAQVSAASLGRGIQRRDIGGDSSQDNAPSRQSETHVVESGETLYAIAWMYDLDHRQLAAANDLEPPYTIYPGQELVVARERVADQRVGSASSQPSAGGNRPAEARENRRRGSVATRQLEGISWQWPADARVSGRFAGDRQGLDIAVDAGQPVYAVADGDVVYAGRGIQGAGNLVILRHSGRHLSAYMHNSRVVVSQGDSVRAGDMIAEAGQSPDGGPLVHFAIRVDGNPVDPTRYLPSRS